jgi:hypothetical protein
VTIELAFAGFFECRLATDPDPFDELRGTSGWTFALPGEPNLDRIIRFQPTGAVLRWGGPAVGVAVRAVALGGADQPGHALIGAPVTLHGGPVFEGRNGLIAGPGEEPVFPFEIGIVSGAFSCRHAMHDTAGAPALVLSAGVSGRPDLLLQAGIGDAAQYRLTRKQSIIDRLATETDPVMKAGLQRRKLWLDRSNTANALMWGPASATMFVDYEYALDRPNGIVTDPDRVLPPIDTAASWKAVFSCGAWDADVLAGYVDGRLILPSVGGVV